MQHYNFFINHAGLKPLPNDPQKKSIYTLSCPLIHQKASVGILVRVTWICFQSS